MCGAFAERCLRGSTEIVEYKPVPVTLRPPEISPGLTWDRTLAPVARDWALGLCSCILLVLDTEHIVSCAGHRTHYVLCWTQNTSRLVLDTEHIMSRG